MREGREAEGATVGLGAVTGGWQGTTGYKQEAESYRKRAGQQVMRGARRRGGGSYRGTGDERSQR